MEKVAGIGGLFFRARDPDGDHLGVGLSAMAAQWRRAGIRVKSIPSAIPTGVSRACMIRKAMPSNRDSRRIPSRPKPRSRHDGKKINYVELPAQKLAAAKTFYTNIFGWALTDFGPALSCTMTGDVDMGLQGDNSAATAHPLAVIAVDDLEAALAAVQKAGREIVKPIFGISGRTAVSFPGSERQRAGGIEDGLNPVGLKHPANDRADRAAIQTAFADDGGRQP